MSVRPNIVICMCDELRWSEVGCYGHPNVRTTHIDRLANEGTRFDVAVSNAPVCMAARSVLLSGQQVRRCAGELGNTYLRFPDGGGFMPQWPQHGRLRLPDPTVAEILGEAGYATTAIGKWHIEAWPHELGFQDWLIPAVQHTHSAQWFCENGGRLFSPPGYSVDYESDRVAQFLEQRRSASAPFFLYYNISPPHMPLADAPDHYTQMYSRDDVVVRENVDRSLNAQTHRNKFQTYLWDYRYYRDLLPYTLDPPHADFDIVDLTAMYLGLVTWVDDCVGRLMTSLEQNGLADDTIVVFTSDHGDNLGSFGLFGKGQLIDESARVPMCVRGPGVEAGQVSQQVASLVDLAPTCLAWAGAGEADHMDGQNLSGVLAGETETTDRNAAFIESGGRGVGIRTPTHMLGVEWDGPDHGLVDRVTQFIDYGADPCGMHDLAGSDEQRDVAESLEQAVREFDRTHEWRQVEPVKMGNRMA